MIEGVTPSELRCKNRYGEALDALSRINEGDLEDGNKSSVYNIRGFCHLSLNNIGRAKECFEHALDLNPASSQANAGLGEIYFLLRDYGTARTMYERATQNNPLNELALYGLKKTKEALSIPEIVSL